MKTPHFTVPRGSWAPQRRWKPVAGGCRVLHVGTQGSNGIGATSVGSLVDTLVEAMTRASDLPSRRADAPLCHVVSQMLRSASLDCSCTLEWARDGTDQYGTDASNLVLSRMNQSAAALVTASCRSKMGWALSGDTPAVARFTPNGPGDGWSQMQRGR